MIGGAGYIAMEFAGLFAALGSDVTVVCRGSNVLRGFDEDVRRAVAGSYTNRGIKLIFATASIASNGGTGTFATATMQGGSTLRLNRAEG